MLTCENYTKKCTFWIYCKALSLSPDLFRLLTNSIHFMFNFQHFLMVKIVRNLFKCLELLDSCPGYCWSCSPSWYLVHRVRRVFDLVWFQRFCPLSLELTPFQHSRLFVIAQLLWSYKNLMFSAGLQFRLAAQTQVPQIRLLDRDTAHYYIKDLFVNLLTY